MSNELLCFHCRMSKGYVRRDNAAHTAARKKCDCCGKEEAILPARHWVKEQECKNEQ